jgi:hypothetical protein
MPFEIIRGAMRSIASAMLGVAVQSGSPTLTASDKPYQVFTANGATVTLPTAPPDGTVFYLANAHTSGTLTIATGGSDTIGYSAGTSTTVRPFGVNGVIYNAANTRYEYLSLRDSDIGRLNSANTWATTQTFSTSPTFSSGLTSNGTISAAGGGVAYNEGQTSATEAVVLTTVETMRKTGGATTATLPAIAASLRTRRYLFINDGSGTWTITADATNTINGGSAGGSITLAVNEMALIVAPETSGTDWMAGKLDALVSS